MNRYLLWLPVMASHLSLMLTFAAAAIVLWLWQDTAPKLDRALQVLESHRTELQQREQAKAWADNQSQLMRLQQHLPSAATIVSNLQKQVGLLELHNVNYSLSQIVPLNLGALSLQSRKLSLSMPAAPLAEILQLWRQLRQTFSCELRLINLNYEGGHAGLSRLELEFIGID